MFSKQSFSKNLKLLSIKNVRTKMVAFDMREIESLCGSIPNIEELELKGFTLSNSILKLMIDSFHSLKKISIDGCEGYDNQVLQMLASSGSRVEHVQVGGCEMSYNTLISYEGIAHFRTTQTNLKSLHFYFCSRIGKKCLDLVGELFGETLEDFSVHRNCFEKICHLNAADMKGLRKCKNLKRLSIVYSRNVSDDIVEVISGMGNLEVLNLR